jgi:hypothetical protein
MLQHACGYALANAGYDTERIRIGSAIARSRARSATRN